MIDAIYGKARTRKWPAPRGPNRHPTNVYWTDWLKGVTYLYRYVPARMQAYFQEVTKGTPWMPRDVHISTARGRAWSFSTDGGVRYFPVPVKHAVSQSLDAIGQFAGQMLYRGANLWEPIAPPGDGAHVLISPDEGEAPVWLPSGDFASGVNAWFPDAPPATPGPDDDEFIVPGSGAPSGWTVWDHPGVTGVTVDAAGLVLEQASSSGAKWAGIYKAMPSGDFTAWCRVALLSGRSNVSQAGLVLLDDPTNANGDFYAAHVSSTSAGHRLEVTFWTAYNTGPTTTLLSSAVNAAGMTHAYFRASRSGTTVSIDWSLDGLGWQRVVSFTQAFTIDWMGLAMNNSASAFTVAARFPFFRTIGDDVLVTRLAEGARGGQS